MNRSAKKKRQQRAQSRLALTRSRQQQREQRQRTADDRAEKQWNTTLRKLGELGATVKQFEERGDGIEKALFEVTFEGKRYRFKARYHLQRWLKHEQKQREEREMSWAEHHVQWMIDNNCDDHGNSWPEDHFKG